MAQVVEYLVSKHKALNSNPSTGGGEDKKKKKDGHEGAETSSDGEEVEELTTTLPSPQLPSHTWARHLASHRADVFFCRTQ
jgi:hypothetical protein